MKCDRIKILIDKSFDQKKVSIDQESKLHIENCQNCTDYYKAAVLTSKISSVLQTNEPRLSDPNELTTKIFTELRNSGNVAKRQDIVRFSQIAIRLLAAASVCLVLIFGIEQYIVIEKMSGLETRLSQVSDENESISQQAGFTGIPFLISDNMKNRALTFLQKSKSPYLLNKFINIRTNQYSFQQLESTSRFLLLHLISKDSAIISGQNIEQLNKEHDE